MGKHTNKEIKEIIVDLHKNGKKLKEISNIIKKPITTIHRIIMKSKDKKIMITRKIEGEIKF